MKLCFVTVGATASFEKLLEQVLTPDFLQTLAERHYTHLLLQYGKDGEKIYNSFLDSGKSHHGLILGGFDFKSSIEPEMIMTTEREKQEQQRGLIICHAGSGTVLAGLRLGTPLIVVPNPDLADNHQQELADVLEQDNYAVSSTIQDIGSAIAKAELQKAEVFSSRSGNNTLFENISDQMGFLD
ncbi:unnamed protein product [Penicillium salamii]|uniref:UDP-N-acetylglucosamine transferase subunit ALG13 n=1 Tax=Penicillium salamii TaxID=1612424 RepID=A0A9W4NC73_9EURO|nr:unnamed protein product [Penicillium salamii]CAG8001930.1 unnamed protein product [Penicillium salamii]CAG8282365.1 unnamed protein product [Penicillium salamii]CAG8326867.1 unnamed protein product [Penicillium salamii]CAG8358307.1 unnamed protein product [Penicillium salamii]